MAQATDTEPWRRAVEGEPDSIVFLEARRRRAELTLDRDLVPGSRS